jgi:hypothetical protein
MMKTTRTKTKMMTTMMMCQYDILHQALVREPCVDPYYYYYYYYCYYHCRIGSAEPNSFEERYAGQHATEASLDYRLMKGAVGESGPDPDPKTGPAW